ncbi:glycoside hydrolase family 1 protein [Enterococcus asini]|uniref:Glycoside hydrolase family 1 protein n=1 Tax=Enterococcus asini TaxID=57732 RepID=A0AAW8TSE7_9ENTE|nr:glycoside hydrolase family 1 protein [Enterococcus asini]MDT2809045.1 glycoside hydrolase family 1 protein [Enterococcus asini]
MTKILWGGATSASQYEGGYENRGIDTQDCRPYSPKTEDATVATRLLTEEVIQEAKRKDGRHYYPFRKGSMGYEHWEEDIALLGDLGLDVYRLSISWTRIFPKGNDEFPSEAGLQYYDRIFHSLKNQGIKIFLTMNHYAVPLHLVESYGGWLNRQMIDDYLRLAEIIFERWGDLIDYYLPFNEINAGYFSPYNGVGLIKNGTNPYAYQDIFLSLHHQFVASAKTIQMGREKGVKGKFGAMISCFCYYAHTSRPEDNLRLVEDEQINQWFCMDILSRGEYPYYMEPFFKKHRVDLNISEEDTKVLRAYTCDFVSFSYYSSSISSVSESNQQTAGNLVATTKNQYLEASEWGWQIDPIGLKTTALKAYDRYQKPIMIAENGLGAKDTLVDGQVHDPYRIEYFKRHFEQLKEAEAMGVPVLAYLAWGIIDIVSAGSCEMDKRYGVVYVDADNQGKGSYRRIKKDSYYWYQQYIAMQKEGE